MIVNTRTGMMRPVQIAGTHIEPENMQISKDKKAKEPAQAGLIANFAQNYLNSDIVNLKISKPQKI